MVTRELEKTIKELAGVYPVITLTGPRQAGKTTLAKMAFPGYTYCNLEHPETRLIAREDPKGFFVQNPLPLIIDEIQRVPELLSYIQVMADELQKNGLFILTGSQQLLVNASVTQSLAGRSALLTLLPFTINEIAAFKNEDISRESYLFKGFLPRIYDQGQEPVTAYRNYLQTYVERDVRQLINVRDLVTFEKFLRLLAGRIGQLLNISSLANDTGVSSTTISHWLSVLEASYIIFRLMPYYENAGKRIIKSAKLYFVEPGLACYLLGIEYENQVGRDPLFGGLFENMVVVEAIKARFNKGRDSNLYFFRDSNHNEVDLVYKAGHRLVPIEIKSAMTYNAEFIKNLKRFTKQADTMPKGYLIYSGDNDFLIDEKFRVMPFTRVSDIFFEQS